MEAAQTIRLHGANLHWEAAGPAGASAAGRAVLFIHGFPFHSGLWAAQLEAVPAGWLALAPDLRGFGRSQPGHQTRYTMDVFARDLIGLLDHLAIQRIAVCGLSMGGYIAFELLRQAPGRVAALVLSDTRARADDDAGRAARHRAAAGARSGELPALLASLLERLLSPVSRESRPRTVERLREIMQATSPESFARAATGMAERPDSSELLPQIRVPTLVVVGADDTVTPPTEARSMVDAIPGAGLEVIAEAGHVPCLERPATFNRAVYGFLQDAMGGDAG